MTVRKKLLLVAKGISGKTNSINILMRSQVHAIAGMTVEGFNHGLSITCLTRSETCLQVLYATRCNAYNFAKIRSLPTHARSTSGIMIEPSAC
jgi:hypothetical protein